MVPPLRRLSFVLGILAIAHTAVFAQQPPDCGSCACALGTPPNPTQSFAANQTAHDALFPAVGSTATWNTAFLGRWHRLYLRQGNRYTLSLCGNVEDTRMYITNAAGTATYACDNDGCGAPGGPSIITFTPPLNQVYRINVFDGACGNYFTDHLTITVERIDPVPAPANDMPCDAVVLPLDSDCQYVNASSTSATYSTPTGADPIVGCIPLIQNDVWFSTIVPASGLLGISTQAIGLCAGAFALYTAPTCASTFTQFPGSCTIQGTTGPTSEPAGVFDVSSLPVGSTVYIRFWERNGDENGTFQICAYEAVPPTNDEPCGAIDIPITANCTPSTFSNAVASNLATVTATVSCGAPADNDTWFSVVVPATGSMTVSSLAGSLGDMGMAWYRLSAGALCGPGTMTQIACSTTGAGGSPMPRINSTQVVPDLMLVPGETIYIRMWSQTPWEGTFNLCAIENTPPVNDNPCGALPLLTNYGCILTGFSNENGSMTSQNLYGAGSIPNPTCGGQPNSDVWFTVVVPPNGVLQLDSDDGLVVNAGMALYRNIGGSCGAGNMQLQQLAGGCSNFGSQQGNASMPYLSMTGLTPGETLYLRFWRQGFTGVDGSFSLCARRTDAPTTDCFYTLTMTDGGGDGWNGSSVEVCVGGNCTSYTVNGSTASVLIGVNVGQMVIVSYDAVGGFQNQNAYQLTQFGGAVFQSGSPPAQGFVFAQTADCIPPPAPQSDCIGAFNLCGQEVQVNQDPAAGIGTVADLSPANRGCLLSNERRGLWYTFTAACSGNLAFTITPVQWFGNFDFAVWGPMNQLTCPPNQPPIRCSSAFGFGATGLAINNTLPTSQGIFSGGWVRHLTVNAGEVYILYIDNWLDFGAQFHLTWNAANSTCPPDPLTNPLGDIIGCVILPVDLARFEVQQGSRHVDIAWRTASERNSHYFEVQRSADGQHFSPVGRVNAAGNSQQTIDYQLVDEDPLVGHSYYRLEMVDTDGNIAYSEVAAVHFKPGHTELQLRPNPAHDRIEVRFAQRDEGVVHWRIADASGRHVSEGNSAAMPGIHRMDLAVDHLEAGSYLLLMHDAQGASLGVARFVKQ